MLEVVPHHFTERDGDPSARAQHGREVGGGDRPHPSPSCVRISRRRRRGPHALPCVPFTPPHRAPRCCFPLPAHRNHARLTLSPPDHLASSSSGGAGTRSASLAFGAGAALGSAYTGAHPPASPVPIPRRLHRSLGLTQTILVFLIRRLLASVREPRPSQASPQAVSDRLCILASRCKANHRSVNALVLVAGLVADDDVSPEETNESW